MMLKTNEMAMNSEKNLVVFVIGENNYKEYDKLFTLFSRELGKVKSYAFGVRREHSKKIGALRLFSLCDVELNCHNDSYTIKDAKIIESFDEISLEYERMCYASYFVELIDYFLFENIESEEVFKLLYYTFKALIRGNIDKELIKNIFELKLLKYQGEYIESSNLKNDNATLKFTWDYVLRSEPKDLYKFTLTDEVYKIFKKEVDKEFNNKIKKKFRSLDKLYI